MLGVFSDESREMTREKLPEKLSGTTMRIFSRITSMQRLVLHREAAFTGKPVVFDIHLKKKVGGWETAKKNVHRKGTKNIGKKGMCIVLTIV